MIDEPIEGMKVKVTSGNCCSGHPRGAKGIIRSVSMRDSFMVVTDDGCSYYHCRNCVEEVPDAE